MQNFAAFGDFRKVIRESRRFTLRKGFSLRRDVAMKGDEGKTIGCCKSLTELSGQEKIRVRANIRIFLEGGRWPSASTLSTAAA
jgi:hypothetical protein